MSDPRIIRGRAEIAERLGRSEKTVSRWIALGILPAKKTGPFTNNAIEARTADVDRLRRRFGGRSEDE